MASYNCPQCQKITVFSSDNLYRPFCSKRCRTLDLGKWADEAYRIPDRTTSVDSEMPIPDETEEIEDEDHFLH